MGAERRRCPDGQVGGNVMANGRPVEGSPDRAASRDSAGSSRAGSHSAGAGHGRGPIGLSRIDGEDFELSQPRGVQEAELDYQEGIELWKAGDPESAHRRVAVCALGLSRQHLGPRRARADRSHGVPRSGIGPRSLRLRLRAGGAQLASWILGPITGRPAQQSSVL